MLLAVGAGIHDAAFIRISAGQHAINVLKYNRARVQGFDIRIVFFENRFEHLNLNPLLHSVDISGMILASYRGGARDHAEG